mmetsp:Transcript_23326/g.75206  ORF Transcript_23326/g.75206 Transcript_23326/m.75206 type:complete len:414 (-) Transcript_23326:1279-2520(-)
MRMSSVVDAPHLPLLQHRRLRRSLRRHRLVGPSARHRRLLDDEPRARPPAEPRAMQQQQQQAAQKRREQRVARAAAHDVERVAADRRGVEAVRHGHAREAGREDGEVAADEARSGGRHGEHACSSRVRGVAPVGGVAPSGRVERACLVQRGDLLVDGQRGDLRLVGGCCVFDDGDEPDRRAHLGREHRHRHRRSGQVPARPVGHDERAAHGGGGEDEKDDRDGAEEHLGAGEAEDACQDGGRPVRSATEHDCLAKSAAALREHEPRRADEGRVCLACGADLDARPHPPADDLLLQHDGAKLEQASDRHGEGDAEPVRGRRVRGGVCKLLLAHHRASEQHAGAHVDGDAGDDRDEEQDDALQQEEEDHEAEGEPGEHRAQPAEKHDHKLGDHDRHAEVALAEEGDLAADGAPVH